MFEPISVNWPYLLIAVALLWFPRHWLRSGKSILKKRHKPDGTLERLAGMGARDPEDRSVQPGREFTNFRNYVDLLRAFAGGYGLIVLAINPIIPNPRWFLTAFGLLLLPFGFVFGAAMPLVAVNTLLILLPPLLSLLTMRPAVIFFRKANSLSSS
jgi:uncharacterized membrane protein